MIDHKGLMFCGKVSGTCVLDSATLHCHYCEADIRECSLCKELYLDLDPCCLNDFLNPDSGDHSNTRSPNGVGSQQAQSVQEQSSRRCFSAHDRSPPTIASVLPSMQPECTAFLGCLAS